MGWEYKFNNDFIENYNDDSYEGYFREVNAQFTIWPERMKVEKVAKLKATFTIKKNMLSHRKF